MADPGTLFDELQGKLGLEAYENSIFQKLTSKIGLNSNFATFTKKSKIWNCHKNWLVIGMKLKFPGNAYLIDSNKWWKFQRNWRTFIDSLRWPWLEWPKDKSSSPQRIAQCLESWPQKEAEEICLLQNSLHIMLKYFLAKKSEKQYYTCRLSMGADSTKIEIFNLNSNKY